MYIYLQMIESLEDEQKFKQIFKTYNKRMHYEAYGILKNKHDTEDAVHNAFVSIAQNIKTIRIDNSAELSAYLVLIVKRKAHAILKSNERYIPIEESNPVFQYDMTLFDKCSLESVLAKLPERYQDLIILHYGIGYSTREIAKIMDIKLNTVQKLLKAAKDKLAEQLEKERDNI